ncbi:MAG: geranylgeranylglycerol-phosphate geranylgeranyltransferase [Cytophagaceae bacterium]|jgi:4-hydroxybenzoate polyprenyltransferase|nr:geranylgeranylglycerol-phosphate geranylgeranyltransferase [Cytophagaceae bacterium]
MSNKNQFLPYLQFLKLIRLPNLLILAVSQWVVFILLLSSDWKAGMVAQEIYLLILASMLAGAAGYIINDYYDIKIDWINKPSRVVVSRFIKRRFAMIFHSVFNVLALLLSLFIGWKIALLVLVIEVLLWWYSNELKRTAFWGNFVVSVLSAFSLLLPGIMMREIPEALWYFAGFAFIISLIREIIKDVEDMDGDAKHGCDTLALKLGMAGIKKITYGLLVLLLVGIAIFTWRYFNTPLLYYCSIVLLPLLIALSIKTYQSRNTSDFTLLSHLCKVIMLAGLFTLLWKS